jgi:hypothetical protein
MKSKKKEITNIISFTIGRNFIYGFIKLKLDTKGPNPSGLILRFLNFFDNFL